MDWWLPIVGLVGGGLVVLVRERLRVAAGRRRQRRAESGEEVDLSVRFGEPGRLAPASLARSGDDVVVSAPRLQVAIPARALASPGAGAWHADPKDGSLTYRVSLEGPQGRPTQLEIAEHLVPALQTLAGRAERARPALSSPEHPRRTALPTLGVVVGLVLTAAALLGALAFQALYATGADVAAHVDQVTRSEDAVNGYACAVSWSDPWTGVRRTAVVDCEDPVQRIGTTTTVHALRHVWPGTAMDLAGSYEALSGLSLGVLLVTGLPTAVAWRRSRRGPRTLLVGRALPVGTQPARHEASASGTTPGGQLSAHARSSLSLPALAGLVAARDMRPDRPEGWADAVRPTAWRRVRAVLSGLPGWGGVLVVAGLVLASAWDSLPGWLRPVWGIVVLLGLLVLAARSGWLLVALARVGRAPVVAELDLSCLRTPDDQYLALLSTGDVTRWVVGVPADLGRLRRVGVRGELAGGVVQLVVDGHEVLTTGDVLRVDEELEEDLRAMVDVLLDGVADPHDAAGGDDQTDLPGDRRQDRTGHASV